MKMTATMTAGIDRKIRTFGFDPSKLSDHSMDDLLELRRRVVEVEYFFHKSSGLAFLLN